MCVIIIKPANAEMDETDLRNCYDNNPDGMGYMYAAEGRVVADKFVPKDFEEFKGVWDSLSNIGAIIHLRYMTTGEVTKSHCHPFRILRKSKRHSDMFFMHNGTFQIDHGEGENDTIAFKKQILKPLLTHNPDAFDNDKFTKMIEDMGGWSRMAFLNGEGKLWFTREKDWTKYGDCLLSNTYSTKEGHRNPPPLTMPPANTTHGRTTSNTTTSTAIRGGRWVKKVDGDGYEYVAFEAPLPITNDLSPMYAPANVDAEDESDIPELMQGMSEEHLLDWIKEEIDDVVATLMTQYEAEVLSDYLAIMGITFSYHLLEEDVEYLVDQYPESAVDFIKNQYFDLLHENQYYKGQVNVN